MADALPEKSFLVQKFAKLPLGAVHVIGYSVAGEETVVQVPELNVCFDIGRCPYFALDYVHAQQPFALGGAGRLQAVTVLRGQGSLAGESATWGSPWGSGRSSPR